MWVSRSDTSHVDTTPTSHVQYTGCSAGQTAEVSWLAGWLDVSIRGQRACGVINPQRDTLHRATSHNPGPRNACMQ